MNGELVYHGAACAQENGCVCVVLTLFFSGNRKKRLHLLIVLY